MPARSQSRNLWPFSSKKKRVVLSKEELKRIGDTQRRAMEADLQRSRGGSSASSHRGTSAPSRTAARPSSVSYKGYTIKPTEDGEAFVIPKLDPDSHFDTLKDAKAFLASWKKNPNEAKKLVKTTQKGGRSVLKFYDTLQAQVGRIADIPRKVVGKLVGEKNPGGYFKAGKKARESGRYSYWLDAWQVKGPKSGAELKKRFKTIEQYEWAKAQFEAGFKSGISHRALGKSQANPQSAAEEMYESFHGKPAGASITVQEWLHEHNDLAILGVLVNFKVATLSGFDVFIGTEDAVSEERDFDETVADEKTVFLAANEDGTQVYFVGGDQSLPLDRFKMGESTDWYRDDMIIGVLYEITYRTKKKFDKFQLTDYFHHLGEETGDQPMLRYDPLSPHQYVSGGKYKIKMPLIGMSPGIEN
jgi:hypothetical protein